MYKGVSLNLQQLHTAMDSAKSQPPQLQEDFIHKNGAQGASHDFLKIIWKRESFLELIYTRESRKSGSKAKQNAYHMFSLSPAKSFQFTTSNQFITCFQNFAVLRQKLSAFLKSGPKKATRPPLIFSAVGLKQNKVAAEESENRKRNQNAMKKIS